MECSNVRYAEIWNRVEISCARHPYMSLLMYAYPSL